MCGNIHARLTANSQNELPALTVLFLLVTELLC